MIKELRNREIPICELCASKGKIRNCTKTVRKSFRYSWLTKNTFWDACDKHAKILEAELKPE